MIFKRNYYNILQVTREADLETIKNSYRKMCKINHPDQGGDHEKMKIINEAYEVLSNADMRLKYDQWLKQIEEQEASSKDDGPIKSEKANNRDFGQAGKDDVSGQENPENSESNSTHKSEEVIFQQTHDNKKKGLSLIFVNRKTLIAVVLIITSIMMVPLFPAYEGIFIFIGWVGVILLYFSTGSIILTVLGLMVLVVIFETISKLLF